MERLAGMLLVDSLVSRRLLFVLAMTPCRDSPPEAH